MTSALPRRKPLSARVLTKVPYAAAAYLVAVGAFCFAIWTADANPLTTLALFGPRWVVALPLLVFAPLAVFARSYWAGVLTVVAGVVVAGPITGGTASIGPIFTSDRPALARIRVVSWNMGGVKAGPAFRQFVEQTEPTIVACQESGLTADQMPKGWTVLGERGNTVATRSPIRFDAFLEFPSLGVGGRLDRYIIDTPDGELTLVDAHLPTARPGIETAIGTKFRDLSELRHIIAIRAEASRTARAWVGRADANVIVVGDFNMPVESRIYREDWSDFRNAFSEAGNGWGTTKQTSWFGIRIDHVLYTQPWRCRKAWIGPGMGSDHRPLVADLVLEDG